MLFSIYLTQNTSDKHVISPQCPQDIWGVRMKELIAKREKVIRSLTCVSS